MNMNRLLSGIRAVAASLIILAVTQAAAQAGNDAVEKSRELYRQALSAYNEHDYGEYLRTMREINDLRRNHPRVIYMLAGACALGGEGDEALAWLNALADMGLVADPQGDPDFDSIKNTDPFEAVVGRLSANAEPVGRSDVAFRIPHARLIPEGIAYDPLSGRFYVGSIYERAIVEIIPNEESAANEGQEAHEVRGFATWERGDGLWSVFGMRVDPARRTLWACTAAIEQSPGVEASELGYAGVFKYDLSSRLVIERYILSNARGKHLFGDMTISRAGDVYVTDSIDRAIYRIDGRTGTFERWMDPNPLFSSPQGISFDDEEHYLFVADYSYGIFRVGVEDREVRPLPYPDDLAVLGVDGIAYYGDGLIAIQNGVRPNRVIRLHLSSKQDRITGWETLEANHPEFDEPTLGIVVRGPARRGATFFYIANSQWGAFDREGKLRPDADLVEPVILKIDLD
jgi:sugar lactone lactonase YvrE